MNGTLLYYSFIDNAIENYLKEDGFDFNNRTPFISDLILDNERIVCCKLLGEVFEFSRLVININCAIFYNKETQKLRIVVYNSKHNLLKEFVTDPIDNDIFINDYSKFCLYVEDNFDFYKNYCHK